MRVFSQLARYQALLRTSDSVRCAFPAGDTTNTVVVESNVAAAITGRCAPLAGNSSSAASTRPGRDSATVVVHLAYAVGCEHGTEAQRCPGSAADAQVSEVVFEVSLFASVAPVDKAS